MKFIQELNESRLYRQLKQLKARTSEELAERFFEHLLALQIVAHEDPSWAKAYAEQIMKYQDLSAFRTSQNDLYNLTALILNPEKYEHILQSTESYAVPELRLKRNLRDIARGAYNNIDYSELMMMLQRQFDNLKGQHIQLRRIISDWEMQNEKEKSVIIRRMLINMRERGVQSDIYVKLERLK